MSGKNHRVVTPKGTITIAFGDRAREVLGEAKEGEMVFIAVKVVKAP